MLFEFAVLAGFLPGLGFGIDTDDSWSNITTLAVFEALPQCSQKCILKVNDDLPQRCESYGCVCSDSTENGSNFLIAATNTEKCVNSNCENSNSGKAVNTFRDICLVRPNDPLPPPNSTDQVPPTISAKTYDSLSDCAKFCLNGCRDATGKAEPNCKPLKEPEGWERYKGLAAELGCYTPLCLCAPGAFNLTYGTLWKTSVRFCNILPSTQNLDSPEYDRLQGTLATYCKDNEYTPDAYSFLVEGKESEYKFELVPNHGLSQSDKIALGCGVGFGFPAVLIQAFMAYFYWKDRFRERAYRAQHPGGHNGNAAIPPNHPSSTPPRASYGPAPTEPRPSDIGLAF